VLVARSRLAVCLYALLGVLIALAGLWRYSANKEWLSGTWPVAFWCGVAAAGIVLFELLLFARKKLRGWRRFPGSARLWMRWHIWLGLLAIPLALVHSGFKLFAGVFSVSTWTIWLFLATSASGIWGLVVQQFLPRRLFDGVPEETVADGIDHLMARYAKDAKDLVEALTLTLDEPAPDPEADRHAPAATIVRPLAAPSVAKQLWKLFDDEVGPYLEGRKPQSALRSPEQARVLFAVLAQQLPDHAQEPARRLEHFCKARRQADRQKRIHFWLHNWLWVHFPLSVALLVLLTWHIIAALKWW
jgi:hypothetical protein